MSRQYPIDVIVQQYFKEKQQFMVPGDAQPHWVLLVLETGSFQYEIDEIAGRADKGELVICPPGLMFCRQTIVPVTFHYVKCNVVDPQQEALISAEMRRLGFKLAFHEETRLGNSLRHLLQLNRRHDRFGQQFKLHLLSDLWMMICLEIEWKQSMEQAASDSLMYAAKKHIEQHASEKLHMREVAAMMHLHPVQFTRRFKAAFGINPYTCLTSLRMEKAKSLLLQTEHTIEHIAIQCGYDNGFHFSRAFTKYAALTPSLYRKMHSIQL